MMALGGSPVLYARDFFCADLGSSLYLWLFNKWADFRLQMVQGSCLCIDKVMQFAI